jgi:hypothetical protein
MFNEVNNRSGLGAVSYATTATSGGAVATGY